MLTASKEGLGNAFAAFAAFFILVVLLFNFVASSKRLVGPTVLLFGLLPLIPVKLVGRSLKSIGADVIYGIVDGGILGVFAFAGASLAGVVGAVFGSAAGNALSDGFGGLWEGAVASWLRARGISEARTPLSASMGKMSGVALGAGSVLTLAWTLLGL